jgi:hypothetical protein
MHTAITSPFEAALSYRYYFDGMVQHTVQGLRLLLAAVI